MGHMNIQHYAARFDEATWQLFAAIGITASYLRDQHRGMVALDQYTRYLLEVLPGDNIFIQTTILEVELKIIRFRHEMHNCATGRLCADSELTGLHIDTQKRKSLPLPEWVAAKVNEVFLDGHDG